jgi:serine/threonine-protein kinase RsbW
MWVSVPAAPASIDILRSVTAVVAGHTQLGFDRVDDLRLAVSEGAGRLIRAGEQRGSLHAAFTVDGAGVAIELTLRGATVPGWPIGPDVDALSWVVIDTLTDDATESLIGEDPCIGLRMRFSRS